MNEATYQQKQLPYPRDLARVKRAQVSSEPKRSWTEIVQESRNAANAEKERFAVWAGENPNWWQE